MITPFITNNQFLDRYDWRWVAENILDDDRDATLNQLLSPTTTAGKRLREFALEASEMVLAAARVGARYSEGDLRSHGGYLLIRIVADLMIAPILKRRNRALSDESQLSKSYNEALQYLELLRRGERIFWAVPNVPEAGLPTTTSLVDNPFTAPLITDHAVDYFGIPYDIGFYRTR